MKVTVAETAGFCYGVSRAVEMAEQAAKSGRSCVMLGPLIHNGREIERLEKLGIACVESLDEIPPGSTVILRSHGESRAVHQYLKDHGFSVVDAACPNVERIHWIARDAENDGRTVVIIGEKEHPEVVAIAGWCEHPVVLSDASEVERWIRETPDIGDRPLTIVSQTTQTREKWEECSEKLKKVCTNIDIFDTICSATRKRQEEAQALADHSDAMIVIGDVHSSNTKRLTELCEAHCPLVLSVEDADRLDKTPLKNASRVGITAGASTPGWVIKEVCGKMSDEVMDTEKVEEGGEPAADVESAQAAEASAVEEAPQAEESAAPEEAAQTEEPAAPEAADQAEEPAAVDETAKADEPAATDDSAEESKAGTEEPVQPDAAEDQEDSNQQTESDESEESFAELLESEDAFQPLHSGQKVVGTVTRITPSEVYVDLGAKQAGYIPVAELSYDANPDVDALVKVGDEIETVVVQVNDAEGFVTLSRKRLEAGKNWEEIHEALENKTPLEITITEQNKGGIVGKYKGIRIFIPASQSGMSRNEDLSELVNTQQKVIVTEENQKRRRVVGSIRAVQREERAARLAEFWDNIEEGKHYTGKVRNMTSYGVFVDIGGVDGMVHISELTWSRVRTPDEVVNVGDELDVYVLSYDQEKGRISLGAKDRSKTPWQNFMETYKVGDVANVRIVKLMSFGAFAEIVPGVDGLIHISQMSLDHVDKPEDVLSVGEKVDAKITKIDESSKKVSLSIRDLLLEERMKEPASDEASPEEKSDEQEPASDESAGSAPAGEEAPAEEPQAAGEEAPAEEPQAAAEEAPAEEPQPAEESAPAEDTAPVEEPAPEEQTEPAAEEENSQDQA